MMSIREQITLLIQHGIDARGNKLRLSDVAKQSGIRYQTLANLINGKSTNPRLRTLQALCHFYGISLDYFACETESDCLTALKQHRMTSASPIIRTIEAETQTLSPKGQRNVLAMMEWAKAARR